MNETRKDLINYRLSRAKDTFEDAQILAEKQKWNSSINRLYYSAYYAVMALLLNSDLKPTTHNNQQTLSAFKTLKRIRNSLFIFNFEITFSTQIDRSLNTDY